MQRSKRPGTPISVKFNSGTSVQPIRRAAAAGNSETRSGVTVNSADATSSGTKPLRSTISRSRRSVASRISAGSSRATVVAPRMPRRIMRGSPRRRPRPRPRRFRDDAAQGGELAVGRRTHGAGRRARPARSVRSAAGPARRPGARRPRTSAAPAGCGPSCSVMSTSETSRRTATTRSCAGAARPSSSRTPRRIFSTAAGSSRPRSVARYVFSTPKRGWVRTLAVSPSSVSSSTPLVS